MKNTTAAVVKKCERYSLPKDREFATVSEALREIQLQLLVIFQPNYESARPRGIHFADMFRKINEFK